MFAVNAVQKPRLVASYYIIVTQVCTRVPVAAARYLSPTISMIRGVVGQVLMHRSMILQSAILKI